MTRAEITGDNRRVVLARRPGGTWRYEAPKVDWRADPRAIGDWLATLRTVDAGTGADGGQLGSRARYGI